MAPFAHARPISVRAIVMARLTGNLADGLTTFQSPADRGFDVLSGRVVHSRYLLREPFHFGGPDRRIDWRLGPHHGVGPAVALRHRALKVWLDDCPHLYALFLEHPVHCGREFIVPTLGTQPRADRDVLSFDYLRDLVGQHPLALHTAYLR
jgi:hypothetical protein